VPTADGRLAGKAAVITGAASGIGRASALRFAREGARLVLAGTQGAAGEALVREIEQAGGTARFVCVDVGRRADNERMLDLCVERYGSLDILFCNAGVNLPKVLTESADDEIDRVLDVNVKGPLYAARHAIPIMVRQARRASWRRPIHRYTARPRARSCCSPRPWRSTTRRAASA